MEIIVALISAALSIILSTVISYFVARAKVKAEIKKLQLQWSHEDTQQLNECFSNLIKYTGAFCSSHSCRDQEKAMYAIANFLSVSPDNIKPIIIEMDRALRKCDFHKLEELRNQSMKMEI